MRDRGAMKTAGVLLCAALAASFLMVGCGGESGGGQAEGEAGVLQAAGINDGAVPFWGGQVSCPVCDNPIDAEFHTEDTKGRIYFDSRECLDKFRSDRDRYEQKLKKAMTEDEEEGGEEDLPPGQDPRAD